MRTLTTGEAAAMLHVSPNTLRTWETRFDFPHPQRTPGHHRRYMHEEIDALAGALASGLAVSSAISHAREAFRADTIELAGALRTLRADRADRAMEVSLALRSLARSVEDVLLLTLAELLRRHGARSVAVGFGHQWACDWMRRMRRVVHPGPASATVLACDATDADLDPARPRLRALELLCASHTPP